MNRIRLLSEQVANQIAAGEVVERPASVVKELVENALDADSWRISVEIQAGGRSLIRISDDGLGMSRDDALLCFERHATSKIRRAEDLSAIQTMGFRGEALPSIASVSRLTLTTRERESETLEATEVIINGGKIIEVRAAGRSPGTTVEVRQLFFNLPARRKFLRSEETEYAHIHHYLTLAALAYPEVAFAFTKDGRTVWQLPAVQAGKGAAGQLAGLRERLRALLGPGEELLAVDYAASFPDETEEHEEAALREEAEKASFRVWGCIGKPGISRATREDQHLFVNRRPVENRGLNFALMEGYHTALMKGRFPVCCLFLEISPALVDVNIHPAKREVKFRNERMVRQLVTQAIRQTLLKFHQGEGKSPDGIPVVQPETGPEPVVETPVPTELNFPCMSGTNKSDVPSIPVTRSFPQIYPVPATLPSPPPAGNAVAQSIPPVQSSTVSKSTGEPAPSTAEATPLLNVPLRLIGVVGRLYVLLESDRGLVLMDQHAAHERILFEQMLNRLESGNSPSQRLLLPETIELSARDAHFLKELLPTLNRLGVGLSEFGERTFLLDGLPPFVTTGKPRQFVLELLDELKATGQEVNSMRLGEHVIAKTVCRHAVKAHDPLSGAELETLIKDLRHCAMPYTCPHGRPTLIEINYRELEKKFGRQQ